MVRRAAPVKPTIAYHCRSLGSDDGRVIAIADEEVHEILDEAFAGVAVGSSGFGGEAGLQAVKALGHLPHLGPMLDVGPIDWVVPGQRVRIDVVD